MKKLLCLVIIVLPLLAIGAPVYYPTDIQGQLTRHELKDQALKDKLFLLLSSPHTRQTSGNDVLGCTSNLGRCFNHIAVGYGSARRYLYTQLHVTRNDSRGPILKEVYCNREVPAATSAEPLSINCEHTWPQSKFSHAFNNELQKSDMHHLFPADINANSTRGNFDFAEVVVNKNLKNCDASKSGASVTSGGDNYFEPPSEHKGNVARALFYFSIRYKMAINQAEVNFLKKWNDLDPVDDAEMARNDAIEKLQGDRNPFIDFPHLSDDISNF